MRALVLVAALCAPWLTAEPAAAAIWPSAVERVAQDLGSSDVAVRRSAAERLADLPAASARKLAAQALLDADVTVRLRAISVALELGLPGVSDAVLPWLSESEPRLRLAAAEAMRKQPSARAVAQLGRTLSDSDPAVRAAAARALGASESADAVLPLLGRLDDSVPEVREEVVLALARLGDPRAVVPLIGKVEDARPNVRRAVARALGELGDARSVGALVLSLRDQDEDVKVAALTALGRIGDPSAVPSIIAVLASEPSALIRAEALAALGKLATPEALNVLLAELSRGEPGEDREPALAALALSGARALPLLKACLESASELERANGCGLALAASGDKASAPLLVRSLERGAVLPEVGLEALGALGEPATVPAVLEYLRAPDPRVRRSARAAALSLLDPEKADGRAVDPVAKALAAPRLAPEERDELVTLLGRTGSPRAARALLPFATNATDPLLRQAALESLGVIGPAGQDAVLLEALSDEHAGVRRTAALALRRVASGKLAAELVRRLERAAEQDRRALALALGGALSRSEDAQLIERVRRLIAASRGAERDELIEALSLSRTAAALGVLSGLARPGSTPADRAKVAEALAKRPQGLPLLRKLASDVDGSVRANAVWSLGALGGGEDAALVRKALSDRDVAVSGNAGVALGRIAARTKAPVKPALCEALSDTRSAVRASALTGLRLAGQRCDPARERRLLAQDRAELVRGAAARLVASVRPEPLDERALSRCAGEDASSRVGELCENPLLQPVRGRESLTVFVVPAGETAPQPRAPFALVFADGTTRLGLTDRRGAVHEPHAPRGLVELSVPAPLAR